MRTIIACLTLCTSFAFAEPDATVRRATSAVRAEALRGYVDQLAAFTTRHTLSSIDPADNEIGAARDWIEQAFRDAVADSGRSGELEVSVVQEPFLIAPDGRRITREVEVRNVLCVIPGAMPEARDRLYYAAAHYDSRASDALDADSAAPGANDDASGTAALIELAHVLAAERLDATVVLMATAGEEQGLFGARRHAQARRDGGADIRAVLNNDTVGDPSGPGGKHAPHEIRVFSEGLPASLLANEDRLGAGVSSIRRYATEYDGISRQLARYIDEVARQHDWLPVKPRLVFRPDRYLRGGDHTAFNEQGYAGVRFTEVHENYDRQHQDVRTEDGRPFGDLAEYVDERYLAGVTMLNAAALIHLANAPSSPPETRVLAGSLTNDTTLRWSPSPEPDVAGYEIVWRDTTSPRWDNTLDVGDATEHTIDLSKDNWFFGVRAYDANGYRSPVALPRAARE